MSALTILPGDCRQTLGTLPAESVQCVVTSPPYYGLRDYGCAGQIGLEQSPEAFVSELVAVFREVRRVLRKDGTLWVNLGDSYANDTKWGGSSGGKHQKALHGSGGVIGRCRHTTGLASKNLMGIPWRVAFALQADGWILRQDIIWAKPNPMPESVTDRCTKSHEYLFLLSKSPSYYFDADAIKDPVAASTVTRLSQDLERQHGSDRVPGKTNGPMKAVGYKGNRREFRGGGTYTNGQSFDNSIAVPNTVPGNTGSRKQLARAHQIAANAGLTQAHFDAIRACGLGDAGKNALTQTGTGKNDPAVQALADEAKKVLGGYYREFLLPDKRNKRSVWTVSAKPYSEAHFATFPPDLIRPCVLAGSRAGDTILDPFGGSGTTGQVALEEGRAAVLCELNPDYCNLIRRRCAITPGFAFTEQAA